MHPCVHAPGCMCAGAAAVAAGAIEPKGARAQTLIKVPQTPGHASAVVVSSQVRFQVLQVQS